ncbi:tryptophan synthase beta subunit-like PLP-dependent enzyme [Xylariomycetidae sp. FL2044]|nr:tryptophan synthase beta subunit-like PLP-dependent enzyme [Xylariomycetidae sp. FL2044]
MYWQGHPKVYGSAALAVAFVAGILVTLGFKDFYPDLEWRFQQRRRRPRAGSTTPANGKAPAPAPASTSASVAAAADARRSSLLLGPVELQDHEGDDPADGDAAALSPALLWPTAGIVEGIEGCIGHTPLIKIRSLSEATGCTILAKAEFLNGAGNSPKDRVALNMIEAAEAEGLLRPGRGDTIYEGTVGSTGISIAALARAKGYRAHICMPDDQSLEKSELLHHLGATVERVPVAPIASPHHFVNLARRRAAEHTASTTDESRGFFADQFESPHNHEAHFRTTGPEIYQQAGGRVDAFVAGAGTGGTIAGVARYLKEEAPRPPAAGSPNCRVVLADPQGSGLYNKIRHGVMYSGTEREGTRRRTQVDSIVEGVGINRTTENFEAGRDLIDDAVRVTDAQACLMARWLVERDGLFVGSSSAVNCVAAVAVAVSGDVAPGGRVVTVLCDSGARHLSKFWRRVRELGLEDEDEDKDKQGGGGDLLGMLGIERKGGGSKK